MARRQTSEADPSASAAGDVIAADWLSTCRRMVATQRELFAAERSIAARTVYDGVGEGGDHTLAIDRRSEDIVFAELERLNEEGLEFTAISEERGEVRFGAANSGATVVIDPLDGSLNARRMLPSFSLSIAVASGRTMADVEVGYVYDFGSDEEYFARRGNGAQVNEEPLRAEGPGFGLEVVGVEGAKPERFRARRIGCAPWARSRSRSATWAAAASTRCSPGAPPARWTRRPANWSLARAAPWSPSPARGST